jgi:release factor glutamine methyltransferase
MDRTGRALIALGRVLQSRGYRFTAVSPATHRRVLCRPDLGTSLESVFGWNRPSGRDAFDATLFGLLEEADALEEAFGQYI